MLVKNDSTLINKISFQFFAQVFENTASNTKRIDSHNSNFMRILKFFNEKLDLEIGTDHAFLRNDEDKPLFKCTGCPSQPFNGVIQCYGDRLPRHLCAGNLHKIFEATRVINNNTKTLFLMHNRYENPQPLREDKGAHFAANLQPREFVDITDENEDGPKVQALAQVIDITGQEQGNWTEAIKVVSAIQLFPNFYFEFCPICNTYLDKCGALREHLDVCFGKLSFGS